ncbi:MAG: hypothetical protein J6M16_06335 [Clostridia bacterium]|nr:hypothetical protein [Clostridia bacterium]
MENKESFELTYSAKQQDEIKKIREKYIRPEIKEDKMEELRRLDKEASNKAATASLIIGIIGALILGSGMSMIMTDINLFIGLGNNEALITGIIVGVVGIILVSLAYPLYNRILKKEQERIAPKIIELTDELMK